ncbi:hypothetical protein H6G97_47370 [Nostoc flagelliforme FACHB-838]|uniref:Uncharacterized protein n=1 Tax=Nostoc flagelliforme FACHB-838 TaxID=2692904 RepID=A0ABR8E4H1_9NOSO|nr:hypothetical protein [Nostoc flagelliforme]MBD2536496.1 hypothetical protein [Nostoc flagelliforme FACHB-838]
MSASAPQQPQTVTLNVTELDSWLEQKIIELVNKVTQGVAIAPAVTATPAKVTPIKEEIDWQAKTDAEIWGSKAPRAGIEKIRRSYQAICLIRQSVCTTILWQLLTQIASQLLTKL